jgi:hypothetical protein
VVIPAPCLSSSLLLAPWVFWQNRIFTIFSGIFPESQISAQKQDTRAILLKTALVHVSCIQNTQIRGEIIAKVFRKVDTVLTYQAPLLRPLVSADSGSFFTILGIDPNERDADLDADLDDADPDDAIHRGIHELPRRRDRVGGSGIPRTG